MALTSLRRNPTPLIAVALITALLGFSGCGLMPGSKPKPTASQGVGKKPVPIAVQLKREIAKRKAAEAKVKELRRLLRQAKARPVRSIGGAISTVKHSGTVKHEHSGEIRFLFGQNGAPTFPVISPPASK